MPHQDTVLLIYVFSIFGLVLLLMFSSFYACHLYAQRLERLNPPSVAPPAQVCNSVQWTAGIAAQCQQLLCMQIQETTAL